MENSGSGLRWALNVDGGERWGRFPGNRGFYAVGLKMIALKNLGMSHTVAHLVINPTINSKTYIDMGQSRPPRVEKILRSFVIGADFSVAHDFSDTMEYFTMDLNSTDLVNLRIVGHDGEKLTLGHGCCVLDFKDM